MAIYHLLTKGMTGGLRSRARARLHVISQHGVRVPLILACGYHFEPITAQTARIIKEYVEAFMAESVAEAHKCFAEAAKISGGADDGAWWKENPAHDAEWKAVSEVAEHTVFFQKSRGFAKKAKQTRANLLASISKAEAEASKVNYSLHEDAEWIAFKCKVDVYVTRTVVTLSECKVMHNIWPQRRTHVDDEIAARAVLADSAMTSVHKMHPAIKATALELVRS